MAKKKDRKQAQNTSSQPLTDLHLTVYPSFALVQGAYGVHLKEGKNRFLLDGLAATCDPNSIHIDKFTGPGPITLGASAYTPANLNPQSAQARALNQKVTAYYLLNPAGKPQQIKGTLLSLYGNVALLETKDGVVEVRNIVGFKYKKLPAGLSNRASISMTAEAEAAGDYVATLLYSASNFHWRAGYQLTYDEKRGVVNWDGNVFITNNSGVSFEDASISVVAGDVAPEPALEAMSARGGRLAMASAAPMAMAESVDSRNVRQAQTQNLGKVKLYAIPGKNSVADGDNQKIPFFVAQEVPTKRENRVSAYHNWHLNRGAGKIEQTVQSSLLFTNDEQSKLGTPLPGGSVSVWVRNEFGNLSMLNGSGHIEDTPVSGSARVSIGEDFDLKAFRYVKDQSREELPSEPAEQQDEQPQAGRHNRRPTKKFRVTSDCAVELFNGKDYPVEFVVEEVLYQGVELKGRHNLTQLNAHQYEAKVTVEPGKTSTIEYRLEQVIEQ